MQKMYDSDNSPGTPGTPGTPGMQANATAKIAETNSKT